MNPNRPGIVLAIALFATLGFSLFAGSPSQAGIRVDKVQGYILQGEPSQPMTRIRMHLYPEDGHGVEDSMDIKIEAPGEIGNSTFNPTGDYYTNKARSLVAFNLNQLGNIQLFLVVQSDGGVQIMRDFGYRVWDLCNRTHHPEFDEENPVVTKIVGNTVYVASEVSSAYWNKYGSETACFVQVNVSPDGQLSLVNFYRKKVKF